MKKFIITIQFTDHFTYWSDAYYAIEAESKESIAMHLHQKAVEAMINVSKKDFDEFYSYGNFKSGYFRNGTDDPNNELLLNIGDFYEYDSALGRICTPEEHITRIEQIIKINS